MGGCGYWPALCVGEAEEGQVEGAEDGVGRDEDAEEADMHADEML